MKMKPIKKCNSGLLLSQINTNLFKFGTPSSIAYNKHQEKVNIIEFELEKHRETIKKLELELNEKDKELKEMLKKNKLHNKKFTKTKKLIEEILKLCDKKNEKEKEMNKNAKTDFIEKKEKIEKTDMDLDSEKKKTLNKFNSSIYSEKSRDNFKTINIENDNETENYNKTNLNTFYTTNNNYNNKKKSLPKIINKKNKLTLDTNNTNTISNSIFNRNKKFKDILYVTTLKNKIVNLNDEIGKKDGKLKELKNTSKASSYSKLQEELITNYKTLGEIKNKNVIMRTKLDDIADSYFVEKEKNGKLKIRLEEFMEQFSDYKKVMTKKNNDLENKLKIYEEKNKECFLYHLNKGYLFRNNNSFYEQSKSKLTDAENIIEYTKKELDEIKKEIDKKNGTLKFFQNEIEILNREKKDLNDKYSRSKVDIDKLIEEKNMLNKKNKELIENNIELKNKLKEKENKYINEIYRIKDIKNKIDKADKNIEELKNELENINDYKKYHLPFDN